jgi:hypothetical protein
MSLLYPSGPPLADGAKGVLLDTHSGNSYLLLSQAC